MEIKNYSLNSYPAKAKARCTEVENRLTGVESGFRSRMNGNSMGGVIFSLIGTLLWAVGFLGLFHHFGNMTEELFLQITAISIGSLLLVMLIDNILSFFHYGRINSFKNRIHFMLSSVSKSKSNIDEKQKKYLAGESKGWNVSIKVEDSIPEKITSIETAAKNMESLKGGFINGLKNVLYYIAVIVFAAVSGMALFEINSEILQWVLDLDLFSELTSEFEMPEDTFQIINIVLLVIVGIFQIILAKSAWSGTNCRVNALTLFVMLFTPIVFPLLMGIGVFLVIGVIFLIQIIIYIIGAIIGFVFLVGCLSGG